MNFNKVIIAYSVHIDDQHDDNEKMKQKIRPLLIALHHQRRGQVTETVASEGDYVLCVLKAHICFIKHITVDGEWVSPLSRLSCTCNELIKPLIKQQTSSKCVADFNYAHRYLCEK